MANPFSNLWPKFRSTIRGVDSSRKLAGGVGLGMMIGLVPKDSLFAWLLILVLLVSNANLLSAACSAILFSWFSPLLDPVFHLIGDKILNISSFEPTFAWLIGLPIVPWTRFDNTVVTGSVVVGIVALVPTLKISERIFDVYGTRIANTVRSTRLVCWLLGTNEPVTGEA